MKKILIVPLSQFGHILPTLSLAKRLIRDKHEVVFVVELKYSKWLNEEGFSTVVIGDKGESNNELVVDNINVGHGKVGNMLDDVSMLLGRLKPDLILIDFYISKLCIPIVLSGYNCITYQVLADIESYGNFPMNCKSLMHHSGSLLVRKIASRLFWAYHLFRKKYKSLFLDKRIKNYTNSEEATCKKIGLRRAVTSTNYFGFDVDTIVLSPSCLSQGNLKRNRYFGYCLVNEGISRNSTRTSGFDFRGKIVYCSFGSGGDRYESSLMTLKLIIDVFSMYSEWVLIVQAGEFYDKLKVHQCNNIKIFDYTSQKQVISESEFVITHGGMGTTKECIQYGKPMLVIPFDYDQFYNASLVRRLKIGMSLSSNKADGKKLKQCIDVMMKDDSYKYNIVKLYSKELDSDEFESAYDRLVQEYELIPQKHPIS